MSGSRRFPEVAVGFVKPADEHGLAASDVKNDGYRPMARCLHDGCPVIGVLVKIQFGIRESFSFQEALECAAVATEVAGVDQEIRAGLSSMGHDEFFGHGHCSPSGDLTPCVTEPCIQREVTSEGPLRVNAHGHPTVEVGHGALVVAQQVLG